jgi:hypothetical protein
MVLVALSTVVGLVIVVATVLSAVRTVVVPRAAQSRLSRRVFRSVRWLFDLRAKAATTYEQRDRIMALYGPLSLLALPLVWIGLVLFGYTLLFWAVGERPLVTAFTVSGSSLLTLGFAKPGSWAGVALAFSEATLGITVLALLLVTYLPSMYAAFARREQAVALLAARAGSPPSGVEMLSRYARIQGLDELDPVWREWEAWFADLQESHTSLPAVAFFRSPVAEHSWVTAAGALLDAAALYASTVDVPAVLPGEIRVPAAEICIRAGYLALRHLATSFRIDYDPDPAPDDPISITREEYDEACAALAAAGVPLCPDRERTWRAFAGWRVNYDTVLLALAALTMAPYAPWSSDRSLFIRPRKLRRRRAPRARRGSSSLRRCSSTTR